MCVRTGHTVPQRVKGEKTKELNMCILTFLKRKYAVQTDRDKLYFQTTSYKLNYSQHLVTPVSIVKCHTKENNYISEVSKIVTATTLLIKYFQVIKNAL